MEICFPVSTEKQKEIVAALKGALAEIELIGSQIRLQRDLAKTLRDSLLNSAFTVTREVA
jgi:hypothetical protein